MKEFYLKPDVSFTELDIESCILDGSVTNCPMKVANVTVEVYENGFGPNGFEEINFD